jgi:hypothetical protein
MQERGCSVEEQQAGKEQAGKERDLSQKRQLSR